MRRHGFLAIVSAGVVAGCAWLLNQNSALDASEETARSFREAARGESENTPPVEDPAGIRLNFFDSRWDRVLRDVADQGKLTLVMDKIPHGSFARRDRRRYEAESAIRILNTELEQQGFRLVKQGNFLIVLKLDQARSKYARPVLTDWRQVGQNTKANQQTQSVGQPRDQRFYPASGRADDGRPRVTWATQQQETQKSNQGLPPQPQRPFADVVKPTPKEEPDAEEDQGPVIQKSVKILNANAADIARSIYLVFESRSELIRKGIDGLPTFVVNDKATSDEGGAPTPLFRIGIDQANSTLLVEATSKRAGHLGQLIAELDKPKIAGDETIKLLPNKGVSDATAKDLNTQIHRMVAMQGPQVSGQADPNAGAGGEDEGALNLRGEVNVQAMQDLGILILKGNEADVAKVERIIAQLEQMSVGSLPDIHLLFLQFVNSEAVAELLSEVYTQLAELRARGGETRNNVAFLPVVKPNAVLILAPKIELESILDLADQLDTRVDPETEFKAFSLRNAIASQVADSITDFYDERGGLGTRVRIIADARLNAVIVQGRSNDLEEIGKLIEKFDRDEPGSVHRVEIVELRHSTAEELQEVINNAIQSASNAAPQPTTTGGTGGGFGGAQANQDLQATKSVALEFLTTTGNGRELIRSGILVDVRVNADPRSNSLIISAPEASMPLLLALVEQLDQAPSAVSEIKVFALQNADAEQSVELLTSLFEDQNQEGELGVVISGAEDSPNSLVPVQFSADVRTNTVLAVGSGESLSVVEAILLRLDTTESRQRKTTVVPMRNVEASIVAAAMIDFLDQQSTLQDSSDALISNIERVRQEVIVTPDDNSNSLIVSASPQYFDQIVQIVEELDANPPQVIIQALIVEVALDNTDEFGVELGFQDPLLFARGLIDTVETITSSSQTAAATLNNQTVISANGNPGFNFNNTISGLGNNVSSLIGGGGNSVTAPNTVATQGISNFSLGRQNGDLGFGGFVFSAQSDAVSVLVRALAARRTVHILSRPQIRTTHNNTASIEVGQQVPVVNGVTVTNNFVTPTILQQNVGIILEVTPRVTADNTIYMDVYAEKSALSGDGVPVFTDVTNGNVVNSVIINSAIADTAVAVPNGQTIVIGGMITKSDSTLERKVPWLGDLPLIGSAFRYDSTTTERAELLIFLTPRIVYGDADSELIKQVETERMHFLESEAEEIHGPIFSVPPSDLDSYLSHPVMGQPIIDVQSGQPLPSGQAVPTEEYPVPEAPSVVLPPQSQTTNDGEPVAPEPPQPTAFGETGSSTEPNTKIVPMSGTRSDRPFTVGQAESNQQVRSAEEQDSKSRANWVSRLLKSGKR